MTSSESLESRIGTLDDFATIASCERLAGLLAQGSVPLGDSAMVPGFEALVTFAEADPSEPLATDAPGAVARALLSAFASDNTLAPLVSFALIKHDGQLATKPILAIGVAASMIIFAASTEIKVTLPHVDVHKTVASPELVEQVAAVLRPSLERHPGPLQKPLPKK